MTRQIYNKTMARDYYSSLRADGKLHGTVKRAVQLWEQRRKAKAIPKRGRLELIPLGSVEIDHA